MRFRKMLLAGVMSLTLLCGSFHIETSATDISEIPADELESVYNMAVDSNSLEGWAQGPHIYSESGIVMDIDSGAILYAKNIDDKHYPASITKVMTALVALQNYEMDEIVKFTWDDIGFLEYGDAHIGIKEDEELSMENCMYGMLLASANEVSHAIGAHMEGGYEAFLAKMNETAKEIGCTNSNWMNTHGLHDPEHYTSARDMALIGAAAFQYEKFREITGTYQYVIPETAVTSEVRYVHQNHKMLREWDDRYYEYCVGGKTGYTDQALSTLITFASKGDMNLVAVVMRTHGGGNNTYVDTRAMLDYAFENFTKTSVTQDMLSNEKLASIEGDSYVVLPANVTMDQLEAVFTEPTAFGDKTGTVEFTYQGQAVGAFEATITEEYYNELHGIEKEGKEEAKNEKGMPLILKIILIILAVLAIAFVALIGFVAYKRKKIEEMRRRRRMQYRGQRDI